MGMGASPNSGYILKVTQESIDQLELDLRGLRKEYPDMDDLDIIRESLTDGSGEELDIKSNKLNVWVLIFYYDGEDGDIYDDLEPNNMYFYFDQEYLYNMELSDAGNKLKEMDIFPDYSRWTVFG